MNSYKSTLRIILCFSILIFIALTNVNAQSNAYNCCIKNAHSTSPSTIEFDIWIEWTGSNTQKLAFFQGGINFNYNGIANGGTITGAFKPGSADPSLPSIQQTPNWNINSTSKQIRLLAAISTLANATSIPTPPGFRLGTFVMTNTVAFTLLSNPNFVWSFSTGTSTTTKSQVSCYLNGASTATNVTDANAFAVHCVYNNGIPCGAPCPTSDAGGPYNSCGDVHLNGNAIFTPTPHWSTTGTGTFDPDINTVNATYHPSASDISSGSITLTLTAQGIPQCGCPDAISSTIVTFTPITDNDICTIDGCDQATGLPTHSAPQCVTLNSTIFVQGFYSGNGMMDNNGAGGFLYVTGVPGALPTQADTIDISAMQANYPWGEVENKKVVLQTDGSVSAIFSSNVVAGNSYYIRIRHHGTLETWSSVPVVFFSTTNYSFSSSASQTYQNNVVPTFDNLYYALIRGDINSDCAIDGADFLELSVGIDEGFGGYIYLDFNGDGSVDGTDFILMDVNIQLGLGCF